MPSTGISVRVSPSSGTLTNVNSDIYLDCFSAIDLHQLTCPALVNDGCELCDEHL